MTELQMQIVHRAQEALASLQAAEAEQDLHLAHIRLGELESLARTADEHDLDVPQLRPYAPQVA
ncbi:hypothetical protein [Mobilicoccus pelagius]|uniref:Uncharacterized protein n=1 Tax=Mobilicoccus pelagius NBRC 104925 TaxID=1089455 RepID=H5UUM8_9MICO|nr:hypothetical protein [Mobilicoccus pelagius]GAB49436.1 hypothetical protein MOPEL_130_00430 [Mobilicoccus pelagius NBRC 104925]